MTLSPAQLKERQTSLLSSLDVLLSKVEKLRKTALFSGDQEAEKQAKKEEMERKKEKKKEKENNKQKQTLQVQEESEGFFLMPRDDFFPSSSSSSAFPSPFGSRNHPPEAIEEDKEAVAAFLLERSREQGLSSSQFIPVESSFYSLSLEERKELLKGQTVHQLCKTIIMENTRAEQDEEEEEEEGEQEQQEQQQDQNDQERKSRKRALSRLLNPRYIQVVVQYTAKLHKQKLINAVFRCLTERRRKYQEEREKRRKEGLLSPQEEAEGELSFAPLSKNKMNFRLVAEEKSDKLSGYRHNSVTPLGCLTPFLVVLSDNIYRLEEDFFFLGGGHVDVKWRVKKEEFVGAFGPLVAEITG